MVSIGNFRNQQLNLGATNRNAATAKTTLQVSTGNSKLRPTGKTTLQNIGQITPGKLEGSKYGSFVGDANGNVSQEVLDARDAIQGDKDAQKRVNEREYKLEQEERLRTDLERSIRNNPPQIPQL